MKTKILIGILLFTALLSLNVLADGDSVHQLVISKIEIPESYVLSNNAMADGNIFKFWWRTPEDAENGGEISVTADENGNILSYYHFKNDYVSRDEGAHFSVYDKSDSRFFTLSFIEKVCPELADKVEYNKSSLKSDITKNMKAASVSYYRIENDIPYYDNYMNFIIDLNTAEVVQYTLKWDFDAIFPDVSQVVSHNAAIKQYAGRIGIGLQYRVRDVEGSKVAYLVYSPNEEKSYVDANTGKIIREDIYGKNLDNVTFYEEAYISENEIEDAEMDSIAAEEYARTIPELGIDSSYTLTYSSYERINGSDCINMEFSRLPNKAYEDMTEEEKLMYDAGDYSYVRLKLNLRNKDILWLRSYNKEAQSVYVTEEEVKSRIDQFLNKYLPLKYDNCKLSDYNSGMKGNMYTAVYICYVGDIPYLGNNIVVEYDCTTDTFIAMDCQWLNGVDFSNSTVSIAVDEATDIIFEKIPFDLAYIKNDNKIIAVYMLFPYQPAAVGAVDGRLKNSDGSNYNTIKYEDYLDIEGHYAQDMIMKLNNNLIVNAEDEYFRPDVSVSQRDFLTWMVAALTGTSYTNSAELYGYLTVNQIIKAEEIYPEAEVLKEDAIVFFIRALGYESIAQAEDIYKLSFDDNNIITPNKFGYIALAKGVGMITGDDNNKIHPKTPLTRADACCMIYKYLSR